MVNRTVADYFGIMLKELASPISGVSVDSRSIKPGEVFFALRGAKVDGQSFVKEAARKGAIAAVVPQHYAGDAAIPLLRVTDPLQALQSLAKSVINLSSAKRVAVTGSVGKTTTKDFIAHLVSAKYRTAVSPGNSNSQIGLPLAIINHTLGDEEIVVLEMGMTEAGQIAKLVSIAPPDIAILNAVELAHASHFDSLKAIAMAKAEIFSHSRTSLGILHGGAVAFDAIVRSSLCPIVTFNGSEPFTGYSARYKNAGCAIFKDGIEVIEVELFSVVGKHNLHNFLAAAIAASELGVGWQEIAERARTLTLPKKRMQIIEKGGVVFVDDSYNASPSSVRAAIVSIPKPRQEGRKIAVLGSMLELGKFSEESHHAVAACALENVDLLFCLGAECEPMEACWKAARRPVELFLDRAKLVQELAHTIQPGDVVLLKGSLSTGVSKIFEELQKEMKF